MAKSVFTRAYRDMLDRLRAARRAAGLSQDAAAKAMGWGQSALSKVERGERRIDPIELRQLALRYGTSVASLVGEEREPPYAARPKRRR